MAEEVLVLVLVSLHDIVSAPPVGFGRQLAYAPPIIATIYSEVIAKRARVTFFLRFFSIQERIWRPKLSIFLAY
jgi:hypothetical protein